VGDRAVRLRAVSRGAGMQHARRREPLAPVNYAGLAEPPRSSARSRHAINALLAERLDQEAGMLRRWRAAPEGLSRMARHENNRGAWPCARSGGVFAGRSAHAGHLHVGDQACGVAHPPDVLKNPRRTREGRGTCSRGIDEHVCSLEDGTVVVDDRDHDHSCQAACPCLAENANP